MQSRNALPSGGGAKKKEPVDLGTVAKVEVQVRNEMASRYSLGLEGVVAGMASVTATPNDRAGGAHNVGIRRRGEGALGAERGAQNERRSVGGAAVAGAALVDAVEVFGVGADSPQRAGPIEVERVSTPGRTKEPGRVRRAAPRAKSAGGQSQNTGEG